MEPRIFVSSTFYDLKYVREQLGHFIESYGFKPVLFENADVGYILNEELDKSCFAEMRNCDMAIVIIGGRYGSPISEERLEKGAAKDKFDQYKSVTSMEFAAAIRKNIPVYVFIDASVNEQYNLYCNNKEAIESQRIDLNFPAVDSINVFRFISEIRSISHVQVETFTRTDDIETYLKKQWASLFQQYLRERQETKAIKDVESPLLEIHRRLKQMEIVLEKISHIVIGTGNHELNVIEEEKEIEATASKFACTFEFLMLAPTPEKIENYLRFFIDKLIECNTDNFLDLPFSDNASDLLAFYSTFNYDNTQVTDVKTRLSLDSEFFAQLQKHKENVISKLLEPSNIKLMKFF